VPVVRQIPGKDGVGRRCVSCSGASSGNIVFRYLSGPDAAASVIASALYQELPPDPAPARDAVAGGRKLLTFSDSRQDAAFFAPYLSRTHGRSVERRLVWESLRKLYESDPTARPRFEDLVPRLVTLGIENDIFEGSAGNLANAALVRRWLFAEVIASDTSQSLEGVGLAKIALIPIDPALVPDGLVPLGLDPKAVVELLSALLATLRMRNAVQVPEDVQISDAVFAPKNFLRYMRGQGNDAEVISWNPANGARNARIDLVERAFSCRGVVADPKEWLANIWGWLTAPGSPGEAIMPIEHHARYGAVRRLSYKAFEFLAAGTEASAFRCNTCRAISWFDIGVCSRYRCTGKTEAIREPDVENHYYNLYTQTLPLRARVEEHTAQLENKVAAKRQADFVRGALNILSCSTTFELGVDVGEIQSVLMRNVPPTPANYVQRAGRAGRRAGSPALVVTYAQRRNHDQHFFAEPRPLIDGRVSAPVIEVENAQIARRHLHAVALAAFLRVFVDAGNENPKTVDVFFEKSQPDVESVCELFVRWLKGHPNELGEALVRIFPPTIAAELGIKDWSWVGALVERPEGADGGWLYVAGEEILGYVSDLQSEKQRFIAEDKLGAANQVDRVLKTIRRTQLISHLARRIVLPKYGFPVDTVSLDVSRGGSAAAGRIELDRDMSLAILEYAPGAEVVADGHLWRSEGVKVPRGLELQTFEWMVCKECGALTSKFSVEDNISIELCRTCSSPSALKRGHFLWPEYGFIGVNSGLAGEQRPPRVGRVEAYFAEYTVPQEPEPVLIAGKIVNIISSRHGEVHLINSGFGAGFRFCVCGRMEAHEPQKRGTRSKWAHKRLGGDIPCGASNFKLRSLGHRYRTDVLEVRLGIPAEVDAYLSAMQAVLAALPEIGISRDDVRGMIRTYEVGSPPAFMLVDAVPGGAGHAQRIAQDLEPLLAAAYLKAATCECAEHTSCYACLRSYENQSVQDKISRALALEVLSHFAGGH